MQGGMRHIFVTMLSVHLKRWANYTAPVMWKSDSVSCTDTQNLKQEITLKQAEPFMLLIMQYREQIASIPDVECATFQWKQDPDQPWIRGLDWKHILPNGSN